MVYDEWSKVFKLAIKKAGELREKDPKKYAGKAGVAKSMKDAWASSEVIKAKDEYAKHKKGGAVRGRTPVRAMATRRHRSRSR
jgi:hypothetical protein